MDSCDYSFDRRHLSFSSSLLDHIYRSIDDSSSISDVSMRKNQHQNRSSSLHENRVRLDKIADDFVRSRNLKHSSSSSSDSSGFSSPESDSFFKRSRSSRSPPEIYHPKPIRTSVERFERSPQEHGSFLKTKSKALKIYSDLKKVKQPISPGGRLATFLNSLFTGAGNTKKPTKTTSTTCSSASSFSRSCLSKTPSSREKSKRTVRFCPVNEDSKRCGHTNNRLYGDYERESSRHHHNSGALENRVMEENRRVIEEAKELLRTYHKNKDVVNISRDEDDDDEDAASCASSDLFELDNLSTIGIERYREELPVYETTRFNTNRIGSK